MLDNIPQSDSDHELDNIPQSDYAHVLDNIPQSDYAHVLDNIRQSNYAHVLDNISQSDSYQECLLTGMSSETEEVSSETEEGPLQQNLRTDKELKKTAIDVSQQTEIASTSTVKSLSLLQQAPWSENKQEMKTDMNIIQKTGMALTNAAVTLRSWR